MKDGPLRRAVKRVALWNVIADLHLRRALARARGERSFVLGGECRRCARCCEAPGIRVGRLIWYLPLARRLFLWWQHQVNGFELTGRHAAGRVFVFRCTHFDWQSRSCDSYESRPGMCRDYPRALLRQPSPEFLPGCGYRAVTPNAARLLAALEGQPLTPSQRERLKKGLHLERQLTRRGRGSPSPWAAPAGTRTRP